MNVPVQLVRYDITATEPSYINYIQSQKDNDVRKFRVKFFAENTEISLTNCVATATITIDNVLIEQELACAITDNSVEVTANASREGIMAVQITVTSGTDVLAMQRPIFVRVTNDIAETAQIDDDSHGSFAEIVREVADARGDYISLSEALAHKLSDADGAVKTASLDSGAVTEAKLSDAAVTTAKISDGAVTEAKLAANVTAALAGKLDAPINKLGAVTPSITEIDKLCSLNTLAERESPGSTYSRFSIQGGNLYLVSGKSATNADAYCLGGFLDGENNVLAKFGTEPATRYNDLLAIAPEGATALIVNTNSSSGSPISCYNAEYDTDFIDEIKSALESIPTKMSDLTNDSGYITERDVDGKVNAPIIKGEAITADSTVSGKIYRFDNGTEYITERGVYSDYTVQGGKLYLISGKAAQSASVYCLGGFFDSQNNLLKKFGTDVVTGGKVYTDYAVTAPDNAVKVRVNTLTPNPISCCNAEYDTDCIDEIKETIAQLSSGYSLDVADALIRQAKKNPFQLATLDKGYVTFVFDDLMNEIDSIASIFEQYQMPLCLAAIPAKMSQRATWLEQTRGSFTPNMLKSEIMRVVVSNGGEILAHNTGPVVNVTNQYDYDFMYGYFVKCKKAIEEEGFNVRGIIKTGGTGAISKTPEIERWLIGNYEYSNIGSAENYNKERININQPLNDLKAAIQDAYTNHTWLRIMGHGYGAEHLGDYLPDEAALEAILDYCNTLGITVCTYAYIFDNFSSSAFLESLKGNQ